MGGRKRRKSFSFSFSYSFSNPQLGQNENEYEKEDDRAARLRYLLVANYLHIGGVFIRATAAPPPGFPFDPLRRSGT